MRSVRLLVHFPFLTSAFKSSEFAVFLASLLVHFTCYFFRISIKNPSFIQIVKLLILKEENLKRLDIFKT